MKLVIKNERPVVNGGRGILGRLGFRARAWSNHELQEIYVAYSSRRNVALIAHEVEHLTEPDFHDNANHHPTWHLCGRSVPVVSKRHLTASSIAFARQLVA